MGNGCRPGLAGLLAGWLADGSGEDCATMPRTKAETATCNPWTEIRIALLQQKCTAVAFATTALVLVLFDADAVVCAAAGVGLLLARVAWGVWKERPGHLVGKTPASSGEPAEGCTVLTREQLQFFEHNGFLVLEQACEREVADKFRRDQIWAGCRSRGIDPEDPKALDGWHTGEKWEIIFHPCGRKNTANNNRYGAMIGSVLTGAQQEFSPLFQSARLIGAIDDLHGKRAEDGYDGNAMSSDAGAAGKRRWEWIGSERLGHVHVRYPLPVRNSWWYPSGVAMRLWSPPTLGWHIDGGGFNPHRLASVGQSLVVLPVFGDVLPGCGATAMVAGSHRRMASFLAAREPTGASYMRLFGQAHWVYNALAALGLCRNEMVTVQAAPCRAGDVLLMHPFLVHSASLNYSNDLRVAFNLGVRWHLPAPAESGKEDDSLQLVQDDLIDLPRLVSAADQGKPLAPLPRFLAQHAPVSDVGQARKQIKYTSIATPLLSTHAETGTHCE